MNFRHRITLSAVLALVPMVGTGCIMTPAHNGAMRTSYRCEAKMITARLEESRGNLAQAKQLYFELCQQDPRNAESSHRLAIVCTRLNQLPEADIYYNQSFAINPNNPELLTDMGYVAFMKRDYERAEALLDRSFKINSNDSRTINNLAIVLAWREKDDASLAAFRRIHKESDAIRHLAAIQVARGDNTRGQFNFELAKKCDLPVVKDAITIASNEHGATTNQAATTTNEPGTTIIIPIEIPAPLPISLPVPSQLIAQQSTDDESSIWSKPVATTSVELNLNQIETVVVQPEIELPGLHTTVSIQPGSELRHHFARTSLMPTIQIASLAAYTPQNYATKNYAINSPSTETVSEPSVREPESELMLPPTPAPPTPVRPSLSSPASIDETASKSTQHFSSLRQPSVWRRTPQSRRGLTEDGRRSTLVMNQVLQTSATDSFQINGKADLMGICLVTLFEERRFAPSSPEFEFEYQSQRYRFASVEALEKFRLDPLRYAPAAGGLDVVSVRNKRSVDQGSLRYAFWYRRQLYLFSSGEHAEEFRREPQKFVSGD